MRLNPFAPNDNPMDQVLFCFGSGEDENENDDVYSYDQDEAADFADRVAQDARDMRAAGDDTDELEDFYSAASGADIMSVIDRSTQLSPSSSPNVGGGGDDRPDYASQEQAFPVPDFKKRKNIKAEPDVSPSVVDPANIYNQVRAFTPDLSVAPNPQFSPRKDRDGGEFLDVDTLFGPIVDTPTVAQGTPAGQIIEQARGPGSPNDIRNREREEQERAQTGPSAMTMQNVGPAGPNEAYVSPAVRSEIIKQAQQPPRDEGITALAKPGGIVKNIVEDLTNRNAAFAREVQRPGNQFQRDAQGNITGVYNPQSNAVFTPESVGLFDLKAQEKAAGDLYDIQRAEQENRRGRGGDDDRPVVASTAAPVTTPEEYIAQGFPVAGTVSPFFGPYSPATQYTGIAGLPQFTLQPTYAAPTMFSPLYNIG